MAYQWNHASGLGTKDATTHNKHSDSETLNTHKEI
jgi:hypothetical protein